MVDTIIKILTPATSQELLTLAELKTMLGIQTTDTSQDAQLQLYIDEVSDWIATHCHRTFGYTEVRETIRCLQPWRFYTSHWPVLETEIESVESPRGEVIDPSLYEVEEQSGKIEFFNDRSEPIVVTYWGGYDLPTNTPPALKMVAIMLIREARNYAMRQAVAGIRSISHKEARVMYFDPAAALGRGPATPFGAITEAIQGLLIDYMRIYV